MKFKLKVKDLGWNKIVKAIRASAGGNVLDVGVFGDSSARESGELTNAEIAFVHEFGSPTAGIPERSFMRSTVDANRPVYNAAIKRIASKVFDGTPAEAAMNLLGMRVANNMKKTIRDHIPPPLKPETIARKGSSTPLVDSGQLITSISWRLEKAK